jgi:seryl-tRNA synthetase
MTMFKIMLLGKAGYSDIYRGSERRRFGDKSTIDQILILNYFLKKNKFYQDLIKWKFGILTKLILGFNSIKSKGLSVLLYFLKNRILKLIKRFENFKKFHSSTQSLLGNLIHNTSIFFGTECKLRIINFLSFAKYNDSENKSLLNHFHLLKKIGAVDYKRGVAVAGNRGYFLKNVGVLLNFSLIRYGLDFLSKKNYISLQTPYFMKNSLLEKCTQLSDFSEQLYNVGNFNNKFLIATSEQPITAFHCSEQIPFLKLPLKYSGVSTCFRKEGGSHGKDTSGIFRVHQFEKVEQFIIGKSDINSWKLFEEMLENSINFYRSLNVPINLIIIPSGSINLSASKKIDLLGFFPSSKTYRELVSCSNCTAHQSKKLNVEFKINSKLKENVPVTMLNSTLCATTRLICCICENYQNKNGISIPPALRGYTGVSFLPFYL